MRAISNDGARHRRPKPANPTIVDTVTPTSIHRGVSRIKMLMSHHGKSFTSTLQHHRRAFADYSTASPSPPSPFSLTGNTAHIATVPSRLPDANHPQCPAQHSCALTGANATAETTSAWYLSTKTRRQYNCPYAYKNKDELTPDWPPTVPRSYVRIRTPAPARPSTRRRTRRSAVRAAMAAAAALSRTP